MIISAAVAPLRASHDTLEPWLYHIRMNGYLRTSEPQDLKAQALQIQRLWTGHSSFFSTAHPRQGRYPSDGNHMRWQRIVDNSTYLVLSALPWRTVDLMICHLPETFNVCVNTPACCFHLRHRWSHHFARHSKLSFPCKRKISLINERQTMIIWKSTWIQLWCSCWF